MWRVADGRRYHRREPQPRIVGQCDLREFSAEFELRVREMALRIVERVPAFVNVDRVLVRRAPNLGDESFIAVAGARSDLLVGLFVKMFAGHGQGG